eukprot:UN08026
MHSTVTFDSTGEVPRNPRVVTSGPHAVTWNKMVVEFDPIYSTHVGTLSIIVDSPYLFDSNGALSEITTIAEIVDTIPLAPNMILNCEYGDEMND